MSDPRGQLTVAYGVFASAAMMLIMAVLFWYDVLDMNVPTALPILLCVIAAVDVAVGIFFLRRASQGPR